MRDGCPGTGKQPAGPAEEVKRMATLKDIADRCGVSIATVSYCINNTKSVKQETRDRIMKAIKDLGYVPNESARTLKTSTAREVGVIFPDIDDLCHSEILKGIISSADESGYSLNIAFSYNTPKLESRLINEFAGRNCAGMILITCQPQNTEFFQNSLVSRNIPSVFIERFPENIDANFLSFDNYKSIYYMTKNLIDRGYDDVMLMCGFDNLFSEHECIRGFTDAHDDAGRVIRSGRIIETVLSKEAAFRQTMYRIVQEPPQAILASSEQLTKGIMEAFNLCGVAVPKQTCVITLGEECWNETNYLPNVIHTSRTAYALGQHSFETLMKNIRSPEFFEKEFMLFKDNVLGTHPRIPEVPKPQVTVRAPKRTLRILGPSLPTLLSMSAVATEFEKEHNIKIECDICSYRDLFNETVECADNKKQRYDLYVFDVSWLPYMGEKDAFADITEFIRSNDVFQRHLVRRNLENCCYKGRYIGFPIVGGSHILFYRRDLFDNPMLQRQFEAMHNSPLRPPKTWTEFNGIAQFFTKEYNPYSPTTYGTSVMGSIHEELALELFIRLWSFGGSLYDSRGRIALDTPQNIKAFQCMLESCRYAQKNFPETSIDQSFHAFGSGNTAMLISFTEYASQISNFVQGDIVSKVDYAMVPGRCPANVGWNFGMSKTTEHSRLIAELYTWLCQKSTSYYMTTLNGQSVINYPYDNHEIMKLYPWMKLTEEGQHFSRDRAYPCIGRSRLVAPYEVETVLSDVFSRMYSKELSIPDALHEGQRELLEKFS